MELLLWLPIFYNSKIKEIPSAVKLPEQTIGPTE